MASKNAVPMLPLPVPYLVNENPSQPTAAFSAVAEKDADVALIFKSGQRILCKKAIISLWSTVLAGVLQDCSQINEYGHVEIPMGEDDDYKLWCSIMPLMFPIPRSRTGIEPLKVTTENAASLSKVADKYNLEVLLELVEDFLMESSTSLDPTVYQWMANANVAPPVSYHQNTRPSAYYWLFESARLNLLRVSVKCTLAIAQYARSATASQKATVEGWMSQHFPRKRSPWGELYELTYAGTYR